MSGFEAFNVSSLKTVAKPVDDTQNGDKLEHIEVPARIPAAPAVEAAPAPAPAVQQAEARGTPPQHQAIPSLVLAHAPDGQLLAQRQPGYVTESPQNNHDPKKRKRNFSNRTKTGCLTCRKRKKKCDEAKPECKWLTTFSVSCSRRANIYIQATTVSKVHSYVRDTILGAALVGPRLSKTRREKLLRGPRSPTTSHPVLLACLLRTIPSLSTSLARNPTRLEQTRILLRYLPAASRPFSVITLLITISNTTMLTRRRY